MNILFVCTGNICRSFAAEIIFNKLYPGHNCISRGTTISDGKRRSAKIKKCLESMSYTPDSNLSKKIQRRDIDWADRIYYMDNNNLNRLIKFFGKSKKYILLSDVIGKDSIIDPYPFKEYEVFSDCCKDIEKCVRGLFQPCFTYGAELEIADIDTTVPIPDDIGTYDYCDYSIANSNGLAIDPRKQWTKYGSEVHLSPSNSIEEAMEKIKKILSIHSSRISINHTCNYHIHIGIPGLKDDLPLLKIVLSYIYKWMPFVLPIIDPLPMEFFIYRSEEERKAYNDRQLRRKRSHHRLIRKGQYTKSMKATTVEEFRESFGMVPSARYCVNLKSLFKNDRSTIEFRHFTMSLNEEYLKNSFIWCHEFMELALRKDMAEVNPVNYIYSKYPSIKFQPFHEFDYSIDRIFTKTGMAFTHSRRKSLEAIKELRNKGII